MNAKAILAVSLITCALLHAREASAQQCPQPANCRQASRQAAREARAANRMPRVPLRYGEAQTPADRIAANRAELLTWHGLYYHAAWGAPVALVVPPTAGAQTNWSWGVSGTRITPIWHQFRRPYPGGFGPFGFLHTPAWPSDTSQFGVYYVRGPW